MSASETKYDCMIWRLQRALPLTARGKAPLLGFLRTRIANIRIAPKLKVISVFPAGGADELMCQFIVEDAGVGRHLFVAPIDHVAFERLHPITQEITAWRRRNRQSGI